MDNAVLEARDVGKACRRHQVLAGIDLTVAAGQLVAVVGERGSTGKPTCGSGTSSRTCGPDGRRW